MALIRDRTAIVGIGQTRFAKVLPESELTMACQAIKAALDDCGIHPSEVDGLASYTMEPYVEVEVARNLGMGDITWFSQVGYGGGAGCGVVGQAAMAVATGQCSVAVAWRSRKRGAASSRP
ncbi:MAG: lipid-transfer protein, partial [Acidimicrobiia bacterium]